MPMFVFGEVDSDNMAGLPRDCCEAKRHPKAKYFACKNLLMPMNENVQLEVKHQIYVKL